MSKIFEFLMALITGSSIPVFSSSSALATMILYVKKKKIQGVIRAFAGGLFAITLLYVSSSGLHLMIENLINDNVKLCTITILTAAMLIYGLGVAGIFGYPWYRTPPKSICEIVEKEPSGSSTLLGFILYFRPTIAGSIAIIISTIINSPLQAIGYFSALYIGITIATIIICYYGAKKIENANDYEEFIDKARKNVGFIIATAGFIGLLSIF